jgi:hypothetical protein
MTTQHLVADTGDLVIGRQTGTIPKHHDAQWAAADVAGDLLVLQAHLHDPNTVETLWTFGYPYHGGMLDADDHLIIAPAHSSGSGYVPIVVPHHGGPVFLNVHNLSTTDDATIRYTLYALTTSLAPTDLLPPAIEGWYGLADAPIDAGATLENQSWCVPGYSRLLVAGTCTVAWAIDVEWVTYGWVSTGSTEHRVRRWTETVAAGAAGELHAEVPMRTDAARVKVRSTGGAGLVTASSRLLR